MWFRVCVFLAAILAGVQVGHSTDGKVGLSIQLERASVESRIYAVSETARCEALRARWPRSERHEGDCTDPARSPLIVDLRDVSRIAITRP